LLVFKSLELLQSQVIRVGTLSALTVIPVPEARKPIRSAYEGLNSESFGMKPDAGTRQWLLD